MSASEDNQYLWLEYVLDRVPTPFFLIDPQNNKVKFSNVAAKKMLGRSVSGSSPGERYGNAILAFNSEGRLLSENEIPSARASRGEILKDEEFTIITSEGKFHIVADSEMIEATHGQEKTAILLLKDFTQLKLAEMALTQSERRLSLALSVSEVGFYIWDIATDRLTLSEQMRKDWGLSSDKILSGIGDILPFVHPEDLDRVRQAIQTTIDHDDPYDIEYRVVQPDTDIVVWLQVKGQVVRDIQKKAIQFFGTALNITARKEHDAYLQKQNEELAAAKAAAEAASATKSAFLANMSHEIRTPLGAIMGFVDLMKDPHTSREDLDHFISVIDRNSDQLLKIIDDILDIAKVEAGKLRLEKTNFSLPGLISDFSSLLGLKAQEKGIEFHVRASSTVPEIIQADPTRIKQILNNVVGNALKFTEKGSVDLILSYRNNLLEFTVKDTGRGISTEQATNLFQAFHQADISTTRQFGGTGLGLALTRHLCEVMGGTFVLVESALGKGSVFKASLEVEVPEISRHLGTTEVRYSNETKVHSSITPLAGLKVLVVEDSPDNQVLLKILISKMGASIDIVSDGQAGIDTALTHKYDVILMDIQMPRMDGHEAVRALRQQNYKGTVVALTAHAMMEERERCFRSGFDDFMTKPILKEALYTLLSDLYHAHRPLNPLKNQ